MLIVNSPKTKFQLSCIWWRHLVTSWSFNTPLEILLMQKEMLLMNPTYSIPVTHNLWFVHTVQSCFVSTSYIWARKRWKRWSLRRIKLCFWAEINLCHCLVMIFQSAYQIKFISQMIDGLRWTWTTCMVAMILDCSI